MKLQIYIVKRILRIIPILVGVIIIIYFLFKLIPGDQAVLLAGPESTQEEIDNLRTELGLNEPILIQLLNHFVNLVQGDFGYSTIYQGSPLEAILERIPYTLLLTLCAIAVTIVLGITGGILAALFYNSILDFSVSLTFISFLAIPNFWIGLLLISFFSIELGILPSFGFSGILSLIMPTLALAARLIAIVARMTRGVVLDELEKDYVKTAYSKGLSTANTIFFHVLRNAMIPVITIIGLETGYLLGGSVVIERLFAWPGLGDLLMNGIGMRDYNLVQGIVIVFVVGFLLINLLTDILYRIFNPKLEYDD